jgi:hypothetical protein
LDIQRHHPISRMIARLFYELRITEWYATFVPAFHHHSFTKT